MAFFRKWGKKASSGDIQLPPPSERKQPPAPNFFIAGAAKSGTTSLWQYLRQHSDIFMPADIGWKEPSYYCDTYGVDSYEAYLSLFRAASTQKMLGEASTPYLTSPESAKKIRDAVPEAKIIILLRNPVERAYSLYKWMLAYDYETITSFEEALQAESRDRKDCPDFINGKFYKGSFCYYWDFLYYSSGLYYEQIKRYYQLFPDDQMAVIIFEEFAKHTLQTVHELYKFLGVDPNFDPEIRVHNQGATGYPPLAAETKHALEQQYFKDVTNLSKLLGRDLKSFWFSDP